MAIRRNLNIPLAPSKFDSKDENKKAQRKARKAVRTGASVGRPGRVAKTEITKHLSKTNITKKDRETKTYENHGKYFKMYKDGHHGEITKTTYDKIRRGAVTMTKKAMLRKKK